MRARKKNRKPWQEVKKIKGRTKKTSKETKESHKSNSRKEKDTNTHAKGPRTKIIREELGTRIDRRAEEIYHFIILLSGIIPFNS